MHSFAVNFLEFQTKLCWSDHETHGGFTLIMKDYICSQWHNKGLIKKTQATHVSLSQTGGIFPRW